MYENYYHEQLAKIWPCVKYPIDAYHWHILPRYMWYIILLKLTLVYGCFSRFLNCTNGTKSRNASHIRFGNLNSRNYRSDSIIVSPVSCFLPSLLVFLEFYWVFLLFPHSVSPVSYIRFCNILIWVFYGEETIFCDFVNFIGKE